MKMSKAKYDANNRYIRSHYTKMTISMPNDEAEKFSKYCERKGYTKTGCIRQLIKDAMENDK